MTLKPYVVLIVDDTPLIRRLCSRYILTAAKEVVEPFLGPIELTVIEADNGEEAERLLRSRRIDLAIIDLMMPVKDGLSLLTDLKTDPLPNPVDIIVCSSMDAPQVIEQALRLEVQGFVSKPLTRERLQEKIQKIFQRKQAQVAIEEARARHVATAIAAPPAPQVVAAPAAPVESSALRTSTRNALAEQPATAQLSNAAAPSHDEAAAWRRRPLQATYPIVYVDQIVYPCRARQEIENRLAFWFVGVDLLGQQEILGVWSTDRESEEFWRAAARSVRGRGADRILIVAGAERSGFSAALRASYPDSDCILDVTELVRCSTELVTWRDRRAFTKDLKEIYSARTAEQAAVAFDSLRDRWQDAYPMALRPWKLAWKSVIALLHYPPEVRTTLFDTATIDAFHRQLTKSLNLTPVFSDDDELLSHFYDIMTSVNGKWAKRAHWATTINQLSVAFADRIEI